jgi:endonuclease YncB( thermonuclease family)
MNLSELARVGDTIECRVRNPQPHTIRMKLLTPESCAHANDLLMDRGSGWTLAQRQG